MAINSRAKGNRYERDMAQAFSTWTGFKMVRTPSSGFTHKTGDICPKEPENMVEFPINIELKKRNTWNLSDLITNKRVKNGIIDWWKQCINDASQSYRIPILIFSKNLDIDYVLMSKAVYDAMFDACPFTIGKFSHKMYDEVDNIGFNAEVVIFSLKDFLKMPYAEALPKLQQLRPKKP